MLASVGPAPRRIAMSSRLSRGLPITLGVVMLVILVLLIVGWVLLAVFGALADQDYAGLYWILLSVGATLLVVLIIGTAIYLWLSVQIINLHRRQSNFVDSVTHELKSPIASLKLYLQTLGRRTIDDEKRAHFYGLMLQDVERLDGLINHLLDAARLERDAGEGDIAEIEVGSLLGECAAEVATRYRQPEGTIGLDVDPCLLTARRVDLEMIFRNLLDNAIKYSLPEPAVKVTLWMESDSNIITQIADNGPGVPEKQRERIFERFERLGTELERETPGTGLGLYIVKTLVQRLGGKVSVRDGDEGQGSVFEVQLPGGKPAPPDLLARLRGLAQKVGLPT
jgi:signal transduction histidine kinase